VQVVYEERSAESYAHALDRASHGSRKALQSILFAVEMAWLLDHVGAQAIPPPRIQFLHIKLIRIARLLTSERLTHKGIVDFLEDLCPCGKPHRIDAIRKLRTRWSAILETKV
jgi:hypothetical protein